MKICEKERGPFWKKDHHGETEFNWTTRIESVCGQYRVTLQCSKLGLSDRAIAEHVVEGRVQWFSIHRKERPALAALEKRIREVKRGLKKPRTNHIKQDLVLRKKS